RPTSTSTGVRRSGMLLPRRTAAELVVGVEVELELPASASAPALRSLSWDFIACRFAMFASADQHQPEQRRNRARSDEGNVLVRRRPLRSRQFSSLLGGSRSDVPRCVPARSIIVW